MGIAAVEMGALTENRKRCFVDLCPPHSPHPMSYLAAVTPASKKSKIQSHSPPPDPKVAAFPSAAPLRRPVHGPQRILRVFNLGSSNSRSLVKREPFSSRMGNFVWSLFKSKKKEGLGLEDYRKLVNDSGFKKVEPGLRLGIGSVEEISLPPTSEVKVLNRKVEDARRVVEESVEVREEKVWVKGRPVFKDLYEEAKKRDPKLSSLEFEVKLVEEKLSTIRAVPKVQEEKPKEDLHELFGPLTDEEEDEVSHAFYSGNRCQLLVTHKASNIEITREVLHCLTSGAWLNDEVINLYLELLKERERREPEKFLKCHFFNTFFYKKLIGGRNGYDFNAVRRWTTQRKLGYSLIECDRIFVPIHKDIHWCLAAINVKDKTFQYLDSLGGMDTVVLKFLARYFMDEVKDKSNKQIDTTSWKQEMVDDLPLQANGYVSVKHACWRCLVTHKHELLGSHVYVGGVFTRPISPDEWERHVLSLFDMLLKPITPKLKLMVKWSSGMTVGCSCSSTPTSTVEVWASVSIRITWNISGRGLRRRF